jgi:hypothetical protein
MGENLKKVNTKILTRRAPAEENNTIEDLHAKKTTMKTTDNTHTTVGSPTSIKNSPTRSKNPPSAESHPITSQEKEMATKKRSPLRPSAETAKE